jgi:hypothetical protein
VKTNEIYEDEYFIVGQEEKYYFIPGFYEIKERNLEWDNSLESISKLATIEKSIRDTLLELGIELVGIYREESTNGDFKVLIIPYHIEALKKLGISPNLYQPYIQYYLENYTVLNNNNVSKTNDAIIEKLKNINEVSL